MIFLVSLVVILGMFFFMDSLHFLLRSRKYDWVSLFPFSYIAFEKFRGCSNTEHDHAEGIKIVLLVNNYFH